MSGLIKASGFPCLLLPRSCDITGHDRLWALQGTHIWAKSSRTRLSGWAQTMEQSFQGCALNFRETHKGWNELRKRLGETGVQRTQQRGIAWQQSNPGGRRKLGKGTEAACLGRRRASHTGRAALNKERGGWWMGRWPPHPLRIWASFMGRLISGGCSKCSREPYEESFTGFPPKALVISLYRWTDSANQPQMFCLQPEELIEIFDDISLSIKCWALSSDTVWSAWRPSWEAVLKWSGLMVI